MSDHLSEAAERPVFAFLCIDGWAGIRREPVVVVAETPQRYRIRAVGSGWVRLAGRERSIRGEETALVPKHAVQFVTPQEPATAGDSKEVPA